MRDLLNIGSKFLKKKMAESAAVRLVYRLDDTAGTPAISVRATRGQSIEQHAEADGSFVTFRAVDFLVPAEDMVNAGVAFDPRPGHRFIDTTVSPAVHYEVCEIPGEPCWRYTDGHRNRVRIHTKQVKAS